MNENELIQQVDLLKQELRELRAKWQVTAIFLGEVLNQLPPQSREQTSKQALMELEQMTQNSGARIDHLELRAQIDWFLKVNTLPHQGQ